eukprot:TRINITY_DN8880_c0_g1_i3.p6 TRINITY_DN8880_c0_g1~~TRINITY_DN8880_c0_g1_i3.p6  ORF type:complete len:115 (-),score=3.74 TRINITY_DN8880_c0_g1_i3:277-621(-)
MNLLLADKKFYFLTECCFSTFSSNRMCYIRYCINYFGEISQQRTIQLVDKSVTNILSSRDFVCNHDQLSHPYVHMVEQRRCGLCMSTYPIVCYICIKELVLEMACQGEVSRYVQ